MKASLVLLLLGLACFAHAGDNYGEEEAEQIEEALDELDDANVAAVGTLWEKKASVDPTPLDEKASELTKLKAAVSDVNAAKNLAEYGSAVVAAVREEEGAVFRQLWDERAEALNAAAEEAQTTSHEIEKGEAMVTRMQNVMEAMHEMLAEELEKLEKCQTTGGSIVDELDTLRGTLKRLEEEEGAMRDEHTALTEDAKRMTAELRQLHAEKEEKRGNIDALSQEATETWDVVLGRTPEGRQKYEELLAQFQSEGGEPAVLLQQLLGSRKALAKELAKDAAEARTSSGRPGCCEPESTEALDAKTEVERATDNVLAALDLVHQRTREVDALIAKHRELAESMDATAAEKREADQELVVALLALAEAAIELHNLRVIRVAVLDDAEASLAHMQGMVRTLRQRLEDVRGNVEASAASARRAQAQVNEARQLHAECQETVELARLQQESINREIDTLRDSNEQLKTQVDEVGKDAAKLARAKLKLDRQVSGMRVEEAQAQAELEAARGALSDRLGKEGRTLLGNMERQLDADAEQSTPPAPAPAAETSNVKPGSIPYMLTRGVAGFIAVGKGYPIPPEEALCAPSSAHKPPKAASCAGIDAATMAENAFQSIATASNSGSSNAVEIWELVPILREVSRKNDLVSKCLKKDMSFQLTLVLHTKRALQEATNPMAIAHNPAEQETARMLIEVSNIFGSPDGSVSIDKNQWVRVMTPAIQEKLDAKAAKAAPATTTTTTLLELQDRNHLRH